MPGHDLRPGLLILGDSYSDSGRGQELYERARTLGISDAEALTPEALGYWQHRWSNGPTAAEILAEHADMQPINLAVGGALSGAGNYHTWLDLVRPSGLMAQVSDYLRGDAEVGPQWGFQDLGQPRVHRAFIFISANDFFYRVREQGADPVTMAAQVTSNVERSLDLLIEEGFDEIMLVGSLQLTWLPAVRDSGMTAAAQHFEHHVDEGMRTLSRRVGERTGISITFFDARQAMTEIAREQEALIIDTPCLNVDQQHQCRSPAQYALWDSYHPEAQLHRLLGERMADQARRRLAW